MFLAETDEQLALRKELREYFAAAAAARGPARRSATPGEGASNFRDLVRQMGATAGSASAGPKEYGGQGRGVLDQFVFFDEVQRAGAPFPFVTINTVGPTLMTLRDATSRSSDFLPGILAGDINFAIGYTEPEAGTDLASLRTRAVRDGDEWVINGNKVFTSGANQADYIWLACRTDPDAPKHKGISIIIVPTSSPGFKTHADRDRRQRRHPGHVLRRRPRAGRQRRRRRSTPAGGSSPTSSTTSASASPRSRASRSACTTTLEAWCRETRRRRRARRPEDDRRAVGADASSPTAHAQLEAMRLLNWRMASAVADGTLTPTDASSAKVFGVETQIAVYRILLEILGAGGYVRAKDRRARCCKGEVERAVARRADQHVRRWRRRGAARDRRDRRSRHDARSSR